MQRLRPYWLHAYLFVFTPLLLLADSRVADVWQQYALGAITFLVLFLSTRLIQPGLRRQVWLCVGVATCFEIVGSLIWGIYRYRFHNLPLYVPPGHGLVYLFGLSAAATPFVQRNARLLTRLALLVASIWALAGLTLLPHYTHRFDLAGALMLPQFAWFVLRSPRGTLFAAIFLATAELELFGTNFGTWTWALSQPHSHLGQGNPPSVIAGGYCVIDGSVILVATGLNRLSAWFMALLRGQETAPVSQPATVPIET